MIQNPPTWAPFDAWFVLWVFGIMGIGVVLAIVGFVITGVIAFRSRDDVSIRAYVELFSKGDVLRLLTVTGILVVLIALAFARLVEGTVAASILSGIAGYVLGGMTGRGRPSALERRQGIIDPTQTGGSQKA